MLNSERKSSEASGPNQKHFGNSGIHSFKKMKFTLAAHFTEKALWPKSQIDSAYDFHSAAERRAEKSPIVTNELGPNQIPQMGVPCNLVKNHLSLVSQ